MSKQQKAKSRDRIRRLRLSRPTEKQAMFLAAKARHVGYGVARGGGKSHILRDKAKRLCLRYPGIRILIVRLTFRELQNNHIDTLIGELKGFAKYNRQDKRFTWFNGSTIDFL